MEQDGSKYKAAIEKKVRILKEDEFIDLINASNPDQEYVDWSTPGFTVTTTGTMRVRGGILGMARWGRLSGGGGVWDK